MAFDAVMGIDEAGLGPLLGPLCIGYCLFRPAQPMTGDAILHDDWWERIGVGRSASERKHGPVVCDSKRLYSPGKGVKSLEEEVLTWCGLDDVPPTTFGDFYSRFCPRAKPFDALDWYTQDTDFPALATPDRVALRAKPLAKHLEDAGLQLIRAGVEPVFAPEFNQRIRRARSKSRVELDVIGSLVGDVWRRYPRLAVVCDRQGGRQHYGRELNDQFPEANVRVLSEAKALSTYELTVDGVAGAPTLFIAFIEKGELGQLPIALGSMFAKYVREMLMARFNAWWSQHLPDLKRTAGYYKDGRRWLADTADLRHALGVSNEHLIRSR